MGNKVDNKFTWLIKDFDFSIRRTKSSDQFVIDGYKWQLLAYQNDDKSFCLDLKLADCESLPSGWRGAVKFSFTVVNYLSQKLSKQIGLTHWFDEKERKKGFSMLPLSHLTDKQCGFLVDGEVEIVARINVCESGNVRKLDVSQVDDGQVIEFQIRKPNDVGAVSSDLNKEMPANLVYVNGFRVLPSQVSFVKRIFGKHPETALGCCTKNQDLRTSYINVLFSLIKMLNKEPQCHTTDDDLSDAEGALAYMKNVGFKLDWLEKKLNEIKESKKRYDRVCELQQHMHDLMNKYRDVQKQFEKERAEMMTRASIQESLDLAFSDVV